MSFCTSASSSRIFWRSRPVRRWSCISRIAFAWSSESAKRAMRPSRAASRSRRLLDELDDLVDVIERDLEAEQDVLALARLAQLVARAPGDDVAPVGDEALEHLLQVQDARLPAVDGEERHAEAGLHRGVRVEVVQHDLRDRVALQLDDDRACPRARTRRGGR